MAALPVALVVSPLLGVSFRGDEHRNIYYNAERFGTNPLEPLGQAISEIDLFLNLGNFRPLGRFVDYTEHALVFEAAQASGLAPHVIQGVVRLGMLVLLALVVQRLVTQLMASSSGGEASRIVPLALAACLVSSGEENPIVHFPFLFIISAVIVLLVCQWVVRDQDLTAQQAQTRDLIAVGLVGAVTASFFDMTYIAPPLALTYLAARSFAEGISPAILMKTAATKRVVALWAGFLLIFVPTRLMIAAECGDGRCYSGSDVAVSSKVFGLVADRVATAFPLSGWHFNSSQAETSGVFFGVKDLFANSFTALSVLAIVIATIVVCLFRNIVPTSDTVSSRPALAVAAFGSVIIMLSALLVSLSSLLQRQQFAIGEGWRDTLLAQTGWALVICGTLSVLSQKTQTSRGQLVLARSVISMLLIVGMSSTLLANERTSLTDRRDPFASVTRQISSSTVNFTFSEDDNAHRCSLLDRYTSFKPDPNAWIGGPQVGATLDQLMLGRFGRPFCDAGG